MIRVLLSSRSARRHELLQQIAVKHDVFVANVDESMQAGETPYDYVLRVAGLKARAAQKVFIDRIIVAADTAVVCDGQVMGKPVDFAHARDTLRKLSGRVHEVYSSVWVQRRDITHSAVNISRVCFRHIGDEEINAYWQSGEPQDRAGAYAIQGRAAIFVERLEGSFSAVMGLPLFETARCLAPFMPAGDH